jgi:hypothetical protein
MFQQRLKVAGLVGAGIVGFCVIGHHLSSSLNAQEAPVVVQNTKTEDSKVAGEADTTGDVWREVRNNPDANMGRIVTFEVNIINYASWDISGRLIINFSEIDNYKNVELNSNELTAGLHEGDNLVVQGSFEGVNSDGYVVITPTYIVNLGV